MSDLTITENELMLILKSNPEIASQVTDEMLTKAKRAFVDARHKFAFTQIHSKDKYRDGRWQTHVMINGKRKGVEKGTEASLYEYLYDHYKALEEGPKTYEDVFEAFVEAKRARAISENTILDYRRYHSYISKKIRKKPLVKITEEEIRSWLVKDYLNRDPKPKKQGLKKMIQQIRAVFEFGVRNRLCIENPARYILIEDYYKICDLSTKKNEEKSFSESDLAILKEHALQNTTNPHAIMILVAMETGMRIGELAAIKVSDIGDNFIHVHRQQTRVPRTDSNTQEFTYVEYTKNERQNPKGGRPVPITPECREALNLALALPGESEYLFHHANGDPVQKDCYGHYLRRLCHKLGITVMNNHAFRIAFNARLIQLGVDGNERCLVLGHSMQTNERHYSLSDARKAEDVLSKLCSAK